MFLSYTERNCCLYNLKNESLVVRLSYILNYCTRKYIRIIYVIINNSDFRVTIHSALNVHLYKFLRTVNNLFTLFVNYFV